MSQEFIYSQTSNSQNDIGHKTLEEIKSRSDVIIKQKCEDDFKLNNLQKDHQDFQKLVEEKNQQISDTEKDNHYLENAIEQLEITRGSVQIDVEMILKSVSEYFELFNDLKTSIQNIISDYNENEEIIGDISKKNQQGSTSDKFQEKQQVLNYKTKLLKDLIESNDKIKDEKTKYIENRKMKIINLDKKEQDLLEEMKLLQNKENELKKEFDLKYKLKDDLQNDLKMKQENFDAVQQKFEIEKLNNDKQIEELELTFNTQRKQIVDLEKKLEELSAKRKTQNSSTQETKNEINSLEKYLTELETIVEKQQQEEFNYKKLIEELRSNSSKILNEDEKLLESLEKELFAINSNNDQTEVNIVNDKKIFENLKQEETSKKDEIKELQVNINNLIKNIQEDELKYAEIINECNMEINKIQTEKQNLLNKKEKLITEKDNITQVISDLQLKKMNFINESVQIESKQNTFMDKINEEITNLKKVLVILEEDCENIKNNYDIQYEEISLKFKERKNEILENTNQYKERMEIIERKAEESFKNEKNRYLDDQTKMELQISEYNAAIDNLKEELKKIVKQINSESNTNNLNENGPSEVKIQTEPEDVDKVFEWTTDEEEYKLHKSQKVKLTPSQTIKNSKTAIKVQNTQKKSDVTEKKKEGSKHKVRRMLIEKISSTDSEFEWIQPSNKAALRHTK